MAAPSTKMYITVLVVFLLFIPAGVVIQYWGVVSQCWRPMIDDERCLREGEECFKKPLFELVGHTGGRAHRVLFLPDSRRALSGGEDSTLRLWDIETGAELRSFALKSGRGWSSSVECAIAVTPDGYYLLCGTSGGLELWDLGTGQKIRSLAGSGQACSVAISPDGALALCGGLDGTVRLWDMETGQQTALGWGGRAVRAVAFSPDGKRAYSGSHGGAIRIWDVAQAKLLKELSSSKLSSSSTRGTYRNPGPTAAFSADGRRAAAVDGTMISVWDLGSEKEIVTFNSMMGTAEFVALAPAGRQAIGGGWGQSTGPRRGGARRWDIETGKVIRTFRVPRHPGESWGNTNDAAFSPDGRYALTAGISAGTSPSSTLFLWRLPDKDGYRLLGLEEKTPDPEDDGTQSPSENPPFERDIF